MFWTSLPVTVVILEQRQNNCGSSVLGVLELGILNAQALKPMKRRDGQATTDAYCVAKYGVKWVTTRIITDSLSPTWNEHYTWEVFDPCTVLTIGVFDDSNLQGGDKVEGVKDSRIGKVRIRLSTLQTGRVYALSYPLMLLDNTGVRKTGEIYLTVHFICSSSLNTTYMYSQALLPKMHYLQNLTKENESHLRHQAQQIIIMRLNRADPPMGKEVVEYMLETGPSMWSIRKSRVNFFRLMAILEAVAKRFDHICNWRNPIITFLIHILFIILEFGLPTSFSPDIVSMRYDCLRMIAATIQTVVGDWATQGKRLLSLRSWRDPRTTAVFLIFCLVSSILFIVTPFRAVTLLTGFYTLRHPWFRFKLPSMTLNFFRKLPTSTDCML
ncbi:hypothetical protein KY289_016864 [Solanum tuberosum]|nr:hypothetical protein KY289_016864 [Solanum tuberosum]